MPTLSKLPSAIHKHRKPEPSSTKKGITTLTLITPNNLHWGRSYTDWGLSTHIISTAEYIPSARLSLLACASLAWTQKPQPSQKGSLDRLLESVQGQRQ